MALKLRLRREGKRKQPFYRVVVADVRSPRDGGFIEDLGYYHPLRDPSAISIDRDRALYWLRNGAQPTEAVRNILRLEGLWQEHRPDEDDPHAERRERRAQRRAAKEHVQASARATHETAAPADEAEAGERAPGGEGEEAAQEPTAEASAEGETVEAAEESDAAEEASAEAEEERSES